MFYLSSLTETGLIFPIGWSQDNKSHWEQALPHVEFKKSLTRVLVERFKLTSVSQAGSTSVNLGFLSKSQFPGHSNHSNTLHYNANILIGAFGTSSLASKNVFLRF